MLIYTTREKTAWNAAKTRGILCVMALEKASAKAIRSLESTVKRMRNSAKEETATLTTGASTVGGAALGAFLDRQFGEERFGLPQNLLVGGAAVAASTFLSKGSMARQIVGGGGLGLLSAAAYRAVFDRVEPT